jgi:hypothetical protein
MKIEQMTAPGPVRPFTGQGIAAAQLRKTGHRWRRAVQSGTPTSVLRDEVANRRLRVAPL